MSAQYDSIGKRYKGLKEMPQNDILISSIIKPLGDVTGLNCLDLACGLGDYSRLLVERGASRVVGVDISESMIKGAREAIPPGAEDKMTFIVGDCSKPLHVEGGPFDLVFAAWLLNYAPDHDTMVNMWRVIHTNLKPGGRFVAITPNTFCPMFEPFDNGYGIRIEAIETLGERGWKVRLSAALESGLLQFEAYHFLHDFYESAAAEAGMREVKWHPSVVPDDERKETEFWDVYLLRPHMSVLTARR